MAYVEAGEPANVVSIAADYAAWLSKTDVPKLFVSRAGRDSHWKAARVLQDVAQPAGGHSVGFHYIQEDSEDEIGAAIAGC